MSKYINRFVAKHKFAMGSPRKVRLIANMVRGKSAQEALGILRCVPNKGARQIEQVVKSAAANALDLRSLTIESLYIVEIRVDGGPMIKRWKPGSRGVSTIEKKRMNHITVVVGDVDELFSEKAKDQDIPEEDQDNQE